MFQVAEGIKGVHILGVVQSKDALEDLLKICPINPQSRYVLIEVGMQKETVQDVLTGLGIVGTMAGVEYKKRIFGEMASVNSTRPTNMQYIQCIVNYLK